MSNERNSNDTALQVSTRHPKVLRALLVLVPWRLSGTDGYFEDQKIQPGPVNKI